MQARDPSAKAIVFSQFVNMLDLIMWRMTADGTKVTEGEGGRKPERERGREGELEWDRYLFFCDRDLLPSSPCSIRTYAFNTPSFFSLLVPPFLSHTQSVPQALGAYEYGRARQGPHSLQGGS